MYRAHTQAVNLILLTPAVQSWPSNWTIRQEMLTSHGHCVYQLRGQYVPVSKLRAYDANVVHGTRYYSHTSEYVDYAAVFIPSWYLLHSRKTPSVQCSHRNDAD